MPCAKWLVIIQFVHVLQDIQETHSIIAKRFQLKLLLKRLQQNNLYQIVLIHKSIVDQIHYWSIARANASQTTQATQNWVVVQDVFLILTVHRIKHVIIHNALILARGYAGRMPFA